MKAAAAALVAALLLLAPPASAARHCTPYNKPIILTGTVVRTMFYGPPNFGEDPAHDERGYYPVFRPDRPPHMCPTPPDSADIPPGAEIARRMQMVFYPLDPKPWYGQHVIATVKLWPWDNAFHHTPVMLDVIAIRRGSG